MLPARGAQQAEQRDIRGRVGQHIGCIRDRDAPRRGGIHIDMLIAHRIGRNGLYRVRQAVDNLAGKPLG